MSPSEMSKLIVHHISFSTFFQVLSKLWECDQSKRNGFCLPTWKLYIYSSGHIVFINVGNRNYEAAYFMAFPKQLKTIISVCATMKNYNQPFKMLLFNLYWCELFLQFCVMLQNIGMPHPYVYLAKWLSKAVQLTKICTNRLYSKPHEQKCHFFVWEKRLRRSPRAEKRLYSDYKPPQD